MVCEQCNAAYIHEPDCPIAWTSLRNGKGKGKACFECGMTYSVESAEEYHNHHRVCPDCREEVTK